MSRAPRLPNSATRQSHSPSVALKAAMAAPASGRNVETGRAVLDHSAVSNCLATGTSLGVPVAKMITNSSDLSGVAPHPGPLPARGEREGPAQREGEGELAACSDA